MDRAFGFAFRGAEARLAGFLLASREGPAPACRVARSTNRREMAQNLGLSPETVIRTLSAFQRRGLVRLDGKSIEVRDRAALEAVSREQ